MAEGPTDGLIRSEEERLAFLDECLANVRDIGERFNDRLTAKRLALLEDYLEGRLKITLELEPDQAGGGMVKVGHHPVPGAIRLEICHPQRKALLANRRFQLMDSDARNGWDDQFVLIEDVELVQGPDGVLPATVGLQFLDHAERVGWSALHLTLHAPPLGGLVAVAGFYERLPIYAGGKVDIRRVADPDGFGAQGNRYIVQRRSDVVDRVANGGSELQGHVAEDTAYDFDFPLIRFWADPDVEIAATGEIDGRALKLRKMSLGPFEL
jgi:hypothetical protein